MSGLRSLLTSTGSQSRADLRPLRVDLDGARHPAGIYVSDVLSKTDLDVSIECLLAFGHPREFVLTEPEATAVRAFPGKLDAA